MVKKILVAPLDWGLGHATRCIPVIRELQRQGAGVIIASSGDALSLLKIEFPEMMALALPAYQPVYPDKGSIVLAMMKQFSKFRKVIREENRLIEKYVADHRIDAVISDNRFGCWSLRATSVCITHQLNPIMPQGFKWLSPWVRKFLGRHFNQFEEIWIPDQPESGLTANFN
ncbi:MAG TPA: hypothetical protein PLR06_11885, partial [Cyclobacteriaceae bacterium]|nr:hypothetical protein [Cyclobacteriaceae bacterium]